MPSSPPQQSAGVNLFTFKQSRASYRPLSRITSFETVIIPQCLRQQLAELVSVCLSVYLGGVPLRPGHHRNLDNFWAQIKPFLSLKLWFYTVCDWHMKTYWHKKAFVWIKVISINSIGPITPWPIHFHSDIWYTDWWYDWEMLIAFWLVYLNDIWQMKVCYKKKILFPQIVMPSPMMAYDVCTTGDMDFNVSRWK